jgi:hypothetical protein
MHTSRIFKYVKTAVSIDAAALGSFKLDHRDVGPEMDAPRAVLWELFGMWRR